MISPLSVLQRANVHIVMLLLSLSLLTLMLLQHVLLCHSKQHGAASAVVAAFLSVVPLVFRFRNLKR